jgi:transposase-like protein
MKVLSLVERGGEVRSFQVPNVTAKTLKPILQKQIAKEAHLMTDEMSSYTAVGREFANHSVVRHSAKEYARGEAHTNTVEGYFSILKRGLIGTYHHVGEQHLIRYVREFDFRYNNRKVADVERTEEALRGIAGKRLTYRRTD